MWRSSAWEDGWLSRARNDWYDDPWARDAVGAAPEGEGVAAEDEESQKYFKTLKSAFLDLARQKGDSST